MQSPLSTWCWPGPAELPLPRPVLFWFRRDLRLADHPGLTAAAAEGPVIPVFVLDPDTEAIGAAPKWRLGEALASLADRLEASGSRLILRRGPALDALAGLALETGAGAVHWSRLYEPGARRRDTAVKAGLKAAGIRALSHPGHLLFEPMQVATGTGGPYRVFTPFWKAIRDRVSGSPLPAPGRLAGPDRWPSSDRLEDWHLGRAMHRGGAIVAGHARIGEAAARDRLDRFLDQGIADYAAARDRLDREGTSRLSENLAWGEISVRSCWQGAVQARMGGSAGAEAFLRELGWREFAHYLAFHTPWITERDWAPAWQGFPWRADNAEATRWRRGLTGEPLVDAAMRQLFVTGTMHNRARMVTASYLTKHLLTDWRVGRDWFADTLIDWDPASNALGWQWVAGSGPDAAPYFRVLNPALQAGKFDPEGGYRARFLANFRSGPQHGDALAYFDAVPRGWGLAPDMDYPAPLIGLAEGRARALAAYNAHRKA